MNVFNRTVTIVLGLAIIGASEMAILIASGTLGLDNLPRGWFEPQIEWLANASGGMKAIVATVSFFVMLSMLMIIIAELRTRGREVRFLISSQDNGMTTVTRDSVRSLVQHIGKGIRNINDIECRVTEKDNGLAIMCIAWVTMGSNLPELSSELQSDIKRLGEELTGLPVKHVDVDLRYERAKSQRLAVR
jgi:uncharacterized alkaline shock family protein YloU